MSACPLLKLSPYFVHKVWGGFRLAKMFSIDTDIPVGEAWLCADLSAHSSLATTLSGEAATLAELGNRFGEALFGKTEEPGFPLLIKLIDAKDDLSVQVHPSKENAAKTKGAHSKDEAWLILDSQGSVLHGFNEGVQRGDFEAALAQKEPEKTLRKADVTRGDVLRVSPGTVHAILKDVFLLEVQEPSDTTYRVWDYERPGQDGKLRELHIDKALEASDFSARTPLFSHQGVLDDNATHEATWWASAPNYSLGGAKTSTHLSLAGNAPVVVIALEHTLIKRGGEVMALSSFECAVIPAKDSKEVIVEGQFVFATTSKNDVTFATGGNA